MRREYAIQQALGQFKFPTSAAAASNRRAPPTQRNVVGVLYCTVVTVVDTIENKGKKKKKESRNSKATAGQQLQHCADGTYWQLAQ